MNRKLLAFTGGSFALGMLLGAFFIQSVDASPLQGAGAPTVVSYQGLISKSGSPFDGTGYFKFAVVNAAGDTSYWSNDGTSSGGGEPSAGVTLPVNDGYFIALLGDTSLSNMGALPASVFSGTERYLRIWFSGDGGSYTLLSRDQPFTAVPYAMQAQDAATLDGLDSTAFYTQTQVDDLLSAYDDRISDLETKLASVSTENGGDDVVFTGVNVHVRDGSGNTDGAVNGLGNLIVGYNEDVGDDAVRSGSHNLIVGTEHSYTSYGGLVVGKSNTISGAFTTVSGGYSNTASGWYSSVSGGYSNTASGWSSSVSGGRYNIASGDYSSVLGGGGETAVDGNEAWAHYSVIGGGMSNTAGDDGGNDRTVGEASAVLAGWANYATEDFSSVSGGYSNTVSGWGSSISGGYENWTLGTYSSVSGGANGGVTGQYNWRAGDLFETD